MKKYNYISTLIISILTLPLFSLTAYANSSWHWISSTKPVDIFPIIVIATLLIETIAINFIPKLKCLPKVFPVVAIGNLLSFLAPYFLENLNWQLDTSTGGYMYPFFESLNSQPFYTTGIVFLIITLAVETPIVYLFLRNKANKNKVLLFTTIGTNVLTTIIVAIAERLLCYGSW